MIAEQARVSIVAGTVASACELCTSEAALSRRSVVVQHPRGGTVQLAACDWCVQALRRLAASTGGSAVFLPTDTAAPVSSTVASVPRGRRPAGPPVLIRELTQRIQDAAGEEFAIQVFGRARFDGTWEGWLEFVGLTTGTILRTGRETTQSKREDVAYWATGLEPAYIRGAFARARNGTTVPRI